jgi:hypothetical protein
MPRYRVLADPMQFDHISTQAAVNELVRVDPECEVTYEFKEGVVSWFTLLASSREIAQRKVQDAARAVGVTDPRAIGGAEAELT